MAFYIQGNFLNFDVGLMNGAYIDWNEYTNKMIIDILIWLIIITISVILSLGMSVFQKIMSFVSAFFCLIQLIALICLAIPGMIPENISTRYDSYMSNKGVNSIGSGDNVIALVLDMFDNEYMEQLLSQDETIFQKLSGFTYYKNNVGLYSTTHYSISQMMTGKIFLNEEERSKWINSAVEDGCYIDKLIESGYSTWVYTCDSSYVPSRILNNSNNIVCEPLKINNYYHFTKTFYRLILNKWAPNIMKKYIWMDGSESDLWKGYDSEYSPYENDNLAFYSEIENEGLEYLDNRQFKFIHIDGTHYPYCINSKCEKVEADSVDAIECARGVMNIVYRYLDCLKQMGAYDKSSIMIIADHGYYHNGLLQNPVLMIKPQNSHGDLQISMKPTSHSNFASKVLDLAGIDYENYGESNIKIGESDSRERFFYQYYLMEQTANEDNCRLIEYVVDSENNRFDNFHLTDREFTIHGDEISHSKYCKTCIDGIDNHVQSIDGYNAIIHEKNANYPK